MDSFFSEFQFLRPLWLLALPVAAIVVVYCARLQASAGWSGIMDHDFIRHLSVSSENTKRGSQLWCLLPAVLACIALAGPSWQALPGTAAGNRQALIIALDLSPSMLATDIQPTRLSVARLKLIDLLRQRTEGETALLAYAGSVHQVTPLTDDPQVIINLVETLEPSVMPQPGSRAEDAVSAARLLLENAELNQGDILLITDGIDTQAINTIEQQLPQHYRLSILATGTLDGAPIPTINGSYLDDHTGNAIKAKLDPAPLRTLTEKFGGRFSQTTIDSADIKHLVTLPPLPFRARVDTDVQHFDSHHDAGYWLCLLLLPMIAWLFRRQLIFIMLPLLLVPLDSKAWEWDDLWQNADQKAADNLTDPANKPTTHQFQNLQWQAIVHYRAGNYGEAINLLQTESSAVSLYNLGNSLAMSGEYEKALTAYELALNTIPTPDGQELDDIVFNHLLVTALRDEQEEQETQTNPDDQDSGDSEQNDNQGGDDNETGTEDEQSNNAETASAGEQQQVGGNTGQGQSLAQGALQEQGPSATANPDTPDESADAQDATKVESESVDSSATDIEGKPADTTASEFEKNSNTVLNPYSEQWLRSLPQDPGGYLRRKFQYEYQIRETSTDNQPSDKIRY